MPLQNTELENQEDFQAKMLPLQTPAVVVRKYKKDDNQDDTPEDNKYIFLR